MKLDRILKLYLKKKRLKIRKQKQYFSHAKSFSQSALR